MKSSRTLAGLGMLTLGLVSCGPRSEGGELSGASAAVSASVASDAGALGNELAKAEFLRAANLVGEPDLASRDVAVRRRAALALARIADSAARPALLRALSDEDPEVVSRAAYGLGFRCVEERDATVSALVARAISLSPEAKRHSIVALARAVGRCAATNSEQTLTAWLQGPTEQAAAAALALGDVASANKKLREETLVSLLARAEGGVSDKPLAEAMFPFSRLDHVPPSVTERLAEVAGARLAEPGPYRLFAIRALGRAKEAGIGGLDRVLLGSEGGFSLPERVEAARSAARLGLEGQVLIGRVIEKLAMDRVALTRVGEPATMMRVALELHKEAPVSPAVLGALSELSGPPDLTARDQRSLSRMRCAAALALAPSAPVAPRLLACDIEQAPVRKLAQLQALRGAKMTPSHDKLLRELLSDKDVAVRQAALSVLGSHPELVDACKHITDSLAHEAPGVVATALETLQKNPNLCTQQAAPRKGKKGAKESDKTAAKTDPKAQEAVLAALSRGQAQHDPELASAALGALAAVGDASHLDAMAPFCASVTPALREKAEQAQTLLSGKKRECKAPDPDLSSWRAPPSDVPALLKLKLETDAGELQLELDGTLAPLLVARVRDLSLRGYYDGTVLHRVDPSFVVQFGSPFGDGFGGPTDLPPLRCETSPRPFEPLDVGVALSGRDTGSSQLFVMLGRHPHLDGQYPWVGRASGAWSQVEIGDVIKKASISP